LQQVVLNLVMNAIEAMQSVAPRILSIRSCGSKPDFVHVAVEDTGTGIEPSNQDHIFDPMFTTKARGMGIGLSICRSIIESHDGHIWVTRGIDKGSIFEFELPARVGHGDQVHQRQA
jgi:signal transduction histidine kinase